MASIPTAPQVERMLDDIEHDVARLREQWKWAAPSIYDRPRRGGVNPATAKPPEDHEMKPRSQPPGSFSDPTGDTVAGSEKFRGKIAHAGRQIQDACNRTGSAVAVINDAMLLLDPPLGPEVADVRLLVHPAGKRDVLRAKAAQGRRGRRAQASGDHSEVTG